MIAYSVIRTPMKVSTDNYSTHLRKVPQQCVLLLILEHHLSRQGTDIIIVPTLGRYPNNVYYC